MSGRQRITTCAATAVLIIASLLQPVAAAAAAEAAPVGMIVNVIDGTGAIRPIQVYDMGGKLLMGINDIGALTRSSVTTAGHIYSLEHAGGLVTLNIDAQTGEVTDNNGGGKQALHVTTNFGACTWRHIHC